MAKVTSSIPFATVNSFSFSGGDFTFSRLTGSVVDLMSVAGPTDDFEALVISLRGENFDQIEAQSSLPLISEIRTTLFGEGRSVLRIDNISISYDEFQRAFNDTGFFGLIESVASEADVFRTSAQDDVIRSFGGNDLVTAGAGDDQIFGEEGDDTLNGQSGRDTISAGAGDDLLIGGGGKDELFGGRGTDRVFGGGGDDTVVAGRGGDVVRGGTGKDVIIGGGGTDRIFGQGGADVVSGGGGDDFLKGQGGADILSGGAGLDTLIGGGGADTFMFGDEADSDEIRGFNGNRDLIDFSESTAVTTFADLTIQDGDRGAEISSTAGVIAVLSGVEAAAIEESDFIFA